jgi:hypothetical protein
MLTDLLEGQLTETSTGGHPTGTTICETEFERKSVYNTKLYG